MLWKITFFGNYFNIVKVKVFCAKQWAIDYCTNVDCRGEESRAHWGQVRKELYSLRAHQPQLRC